MTNEELQARVMAIEAAYFSDSMQEISELTRERDEARRIARRLSKALVNALDNLGRDGEPLRTRMEGDAALAEYWASIDGKRERKPFGWVCQLGSENIHDVWIGADPHPAGMSDELLNALERGAVEIRAEGHNGWGNTIDEAAARIRALTDENSKLFQSNMGFAERIERLQSDLAAAERSLDRHRADAEGCVWRVKNSQLG